jgi:phage terminase small subunit
MPPLKARQERFCRRFVELACAATAARAAGFAPKGSKVAGYRLLRHPRIAARIAEIEAQTARLHSRSSEVLIGKLENVYRRAVVDHQFHAAARAVDLQARIRGFTAPLAVSAAAEAETETETRSGTPPPGGHRFRAPARGDLRRGRGGETGLEGF